MQYSTQCWHDILSYCQHSMQMAYLIMPMTFHSSNSPSWNSRLSSSPILIIYWSWRIWLTYSVGVIDYDVPMAGNIYGECWFVLSMMPSIDDHSPSYAIPPPDHSLIIICFMLNSNSYIRKLKTEGYIVRDSFKTNENAPKRIR